MKRRTFLHLSGLAAGSLLLSPTLARGAGRLGQAARITYGLQVATTPDFRAASLIIDEQGLLVPAFDLANLDANTTYFWRVNASSELGPSPWSAAARFTTGTAVGTEQPDAVPERYELGHNYPNPFNPTTTIPFTLAEAGPVQLKVYNMLGQEVATLVDGHLGVGNHQAVWEAHDLASGTYVYILKAGAFTKTRQMILLK